MVPLSVEAQDQIESYKNGWGGVGIKHFTFIFLLVVGLWARSSMSCPENEMRDKWAHCFFVLLYVL